MDLESGLFWVVAAVTGTCAVGVVVTQNIVRAATWLLFALAGTSAVFFLLGADFVGATQLLVYVGGTLVLVVFGVMLTAQGPFVIMRTSAAEWAVAMAVGLLLFGVLAATFVTGGGSLVQAGEAPAGMTDPSQSMSSLQLGEALLGVDDVNPAGGVPGVVNSARQRVSYLLPFEVVSVHLLVVLIGAAYLARAKRRRGAVA